MGLTDIRVLKLRLKFFLELREAYRSHKPPRNSDFTSGLYYWYNEGRGFQIGLRLKSLLEYPTDLAQIFLFSYEKPYNWAMKENVWISLRNNNIFITSQCMPWVNHSKMLLLKDFGNLETPSNLLLPVILFKFRVLLLNLFLFNYIWILIN